uniref:uncharacterized protein LOC125906554 n=1 Tax=Anopheles coluzzii TaxID=1518534 RepID=UPI0020FFDC6C|nr:uncharacterized protein LOC125906554 [Anopheles coluzzii]XP_049461920.1 uncharacterized protein LOC125906554 [Anopheles coluzzii]
MEIWLVISQRSSVRWAQYFDELLNDQFNEQLEAPLADSVMLLPPSIEETRKAIRRLKNNKASGTDGIAAELVQNGGARLENEIHQTVAEVWDSKSMPCDWNLGIIYPIYEKGDRLDYNNYRFITVLNTAHKIFSLILQDRLVPHVEEIVGNYQRGFRNGKSTTDQIFTMRQILEKMAKYRNDTYHLFIDFKAAYDSIARVKLYDAMSSYGIPAKLIRLFRMTMTNVTCQVKVDGKLSGPFATTKGLRHGGGLACLLFNLALERAIRDFKIETTGTIFYKSSQILAYHDDIYIIGLRLSYVAEAYQKIEQVAENLGLQINEAQTKLLVATSAGLPINNQNLRRCYVQIYQRPFESSHNSHFTGQATTIAW